MNSTWLLVSALAVLLGLSACARRNALIFNAQSFEIPFDKNANQTLTYPEIIAVYEKMAAAFPKVFRLEAVGKTDIGEPLHVGVLSVSGEFSPEKIRQSDKRILLINNGIHPGEPEGIDATVLLLRDFLTKPETRKVLENVVVVVIPVYNVDGCLNRNSHSRANQNGPESYGFRGNARNYDLNRDFIKCDTRNAQTFHHIFQTWQPDVFLDNHTSNGADYQYVMTMIATQHNKLEAPLGEFLDQKMMPALHADMAAKGWEMSPYVDGLDDEGRPDSGIVGFLDYGRYSTGYAALWNTIGFVPETHMLKPFKDRVWATRAFMESIIGFTNDNAAEIGRLRSEALARTRSKSEFALDWKLDKSQRKPLIFKGFAAKMKPSEVSGLPRLWYDRSEPFTKEIPFFNEYQPTATATKPKAYVVPQAWENVVRLLDLNCVQMRRLDRDTTLETETYFIREFKNRERWEGHYYHHSVKIEVKTLSREFRKGDFYIETGQNADRFLVETLEPNAPDSYFAWNFFDPILMQKEYFSSYVFEDLAAEFLRDNPKVRAELEAKKQAEPEFAKNAGAQLDWVYRRSPFYEPTHQLYPVARVVR